MNDTSDSLFGLTPLPPGRWVVHPSGQPLTMWAIARAAGLSPDEIKAWLPHITRPKPVLRLLEGGKP